MKTVLDLQQLGKRLAILDSLLLLLAGRRMELAEQVGEFKMKHGESIFRADVEDRRIAAIRLLAEQHGLNPHFAESLLYLLINESCKRQMIQLQDKNFSNEPQTDDEWHTLLRKNLLRLTERWSDTYDAEYGNGCPATAAYIDYEQTVLKREINRLSDTDTAVDIGCATGKISFSLSTYFNKVIGYDVSQHMVARRRVCRRKASGRDRFFRDSRCRRWYSVRRQRSFLCCHESRDRGRHT